MERNKLKIIVYDNSGHAFPIQLSRSLARNGYQVLHIYSKSFQTPKGNLDKKGDDPDTLKIVGLSLSRSFNKYSFYERWTQEKEFGRLISTEIENFQPDVLISSNVPLDTQKYVVKTCKALNVRFIFWVQDYYGIAIKKILESKIFFLGTLIGRFYISLEKRLLKISDKIVLITEDFRTLTAKWGIENSKITIIPNWAPIEEIPVESKKNTWSIQYGLDDKFCFFYTGTLGLKHNPELLLELAIKFQREKNVRVVVISEGLGAEWLKGKRNELHLENLVLMDFQPFELLSKVMGTADVLISILENDAGVYSVPSKVLSYLCAKRPLLLAVPLENLAARIVQQFEMGLAVLPNEKVQFVNSAKLLYDDENMRISMANNARNYAEKYFNINDITDKFIDIITDDKKKDT